MNLPKRSAFTVQEALQQAPTLARLSDLARQSAARLAIVKPLLPAAMRDAVRAGGVDNESWCLLVPHNAAGAKVRQLAPALLAALNSAGHPVQTLRVKVGQDV